MDLFYHLFVAPEAARKCTPPSTGAVLLNQGNCCLVLLNKFYLCRIFSCSSGFSCEFSPGPTETVQPGPGHNGSATDSAAAIPYYSAHRASTAEEPSGSHKSSAHPGWHSSSFSKCTCKLKYDQPNIYNILKERRVASAIAEQQAFSRQQTELIQQQIGEQLQTHPGEATAVAKQQAFSRQQTNMVEHHIQQQVMQQLHQPHVAKQQEFSQQQTQLIAQQRRQQSMNQLQQPKQTQISATLAKRKEFSQQQ